MSNNPREELINKLKPLVNNKDQWDNFSNYLTYLIAQNHAVMEQTSDLIMLHRAQGAITILKQLRKLRDNINSL
jgi:hypothetical protein